LVFFGYVLEGWFVLLLLLWLLLLLLLFISWMNLVGDAILLSSVGRARDGKLTHHACWEKTTDAHGGVKFGPGGRGRRMKDGWMDELDG
jgi:hypothetical protein